MSQEVSVSVPSVSEKVSVPCVSEEVSVSERV